MANDVTYTMYAVLPIHYVYNLQIDYEMCVCVCVFFRPLSEAVIHGVCALCHQLMMVWKSTGVSFSRFLQQLSVSPALLQPLWTSVENIHLEGFRYSLTLTCTVEPL